MTIQITDQQFIDALEAAVAERGRVVFIRSKFKGA